MSSLDIFRKTKDKEPEYQTTNNGKIANFVSEELT
jgi:hypothetical protein